MPQMDAGLINSEGHSPQHDKIPLGDVISCRVRRNSSQLPINIFNVALRSLHRMKTEGSICFSSPIAIARPDTTNNLEKIASPVGQKLTSSKDESVVFPERKFVTRSSKAAISFGSNRPAVGSWQNVAPESDSQGTEEKKGKSEKFREVRGVDSSTELASTAHSLIWQVVIQHVQEARTILDELFSANPRPRDPSTVSETCSLDEETTRRGGRYEPKASIRIEHRIAAAARRAKHLITSVFVDVSRTVTDASISSISTANTVNRDSPKYTRTRLNACGNTVLTSVYVARAPDAVSKDSRFISATFILDFSLLAPAQLKSLESSQSQPHSIPSRELPSSRKESTAQKARRLYTQRKLIYKPSPCERETKTGKASRKRTKSLPALSETTSSTIFKEDAVVQQSRETEKSLLPRASKLPRVKGKAYADSLQSGYALTTSATNWTTRTSSPAASTASPQSDVKQRLTELQRKDETEKSLLQQTTKLPRATRPVSIGSTTDAAIFATPRRSAAESARFLASSSDTSYPISPSQFHHRPWSCESTTPASKSARTSRLPHAVRKFC